MVPKAAGVRQMPRYTFKLFDDSGAVEDDVGVSLPTAEVAYRYACDVALELMNCRELRTRHWQLDVYEGDADRTRGEVAGGALARQAVPGGGSRPQGDTRQ